MIEVIEAAATIATEEAIVTMIAEALTTTKATSVELRGVFVR
jgi:hypothetical protein